MKAERICLVTTGLLLGLVASGCRESNPAYIHKDAASDAAMGPDTKPNSDEDGAIPPDNGPDRADLPPNAGM